MLDASSSDTPKSKKKTPQTRPLQRFWPNSLASSVSQQQVTMEDGTAHKSTINYTEEILVREVFSELFGHLDTRLV